MSAQEKDNLGLTETTLPFNTNWGLVFSSMLESEAKQKQQKQKATPKLIYSNCKNKIWRGQSSFHAH